MRILAFDTATRATTVALCAGDGPVLEARDDPAPGRRPGHATRLMPMAVELLSQTGLRWDAIDRIAVGVGPGTFTGLRVGIATARALARSRGIPLTGVSTLHSLAINAKARADAATVLAVLDARRGEAFVAAWALDEPEEQLLAPSVVAPDALPALLEGFPSPVLAIGDGAVEFRMVLERSGALVPEDESGLHRVTAINHCKLARTLTGGAPEKVVPEYLRLPDAEIARRAASMP